MNNRIYIEQLTLIGSRKNYTIKFREGLNYISGHTSTGKTSILEMLDYALGSKGHKSYIEIGNSCSRVELVLFIGESKYKISRELFNFKMPVIVEEWDAVKEKFLFYNRFDVDGPSNPKSLSAFLIEKLGLADMSISNQTFSFRDIFKYCYIKQTEIDNEDILNEKSWEKDFKRKATFEIIFNIYDKALEEYKNSLDQKKHELQELTIKLSGVNEFLQTVEIADIKECTNIEINLRKEIENLKTQLGELKKGESLDETSISLRREIIRLKQQQEKMLIGINDQKQYLSKLRLLYNQYTSEIDKKELAINGYLVFNQYEFVFCPNCLKPIEKTDTVDKCCLCGSEKNDENEELLLLKKEITILKRKTKEVSKYIEVEDEKLNKLIKQEKILSQQIFENETELQHLTTGYVNPNMEKIEFLNYEIGKKSRLIFELQKNLKMFEEVERYHKLIEAKEKSISLLKDNIKTLKENRVDKQELLAELSNQFNDVLKQFNYPKLSLAHIDDKRYLPYVRGRKYDDIGSLAGVSLITMAYYLSILLIGIEAEYYHPGLLIIDSPRKNLGAQAASDENEEFKDEKIFNSIIDFLSKTAEQNKNKIQLIVVNNGYPEFLSKSCIVAEFDSERHGDLPAGLIDDAIN